MIKRKPDPLWDVAVELCDGGGRGPITKTERGMWNKGLGDIRDAGGTPDELRQAIATYRRKHKGYPCHPMTLAKHWGQLLADGAPGLAETRLRELEDRWGDIPIEDRWRIAGMLGHAPGCSPSPYELTAFQLRQALAIWDKEQK